MAAHPTTGSPTSGQSVELHESTGKSSLGRVQRASATELIVAVPTDAGIAKTAGPGSTFDVVWPQRGGVGVLPVTLTQRRAGPQMEVWRCAPRAAAHFEQRRQQTRIPSTGPLRLTVYPEMGPRALGSDGEASLRGVLVDISEVALQCVVMVGPTDVVITSGTRVSCSFTPDGGPDFALRGVVHSAWTEDAPPQVRTVVRFDDSQTGLDDLLRFVTSDRST